MPLKPDNLQIFLDTYSCYTKNNLSCLLMLHIRLVCIYMNYNLSSLVMPQGWFVCSAHKELPRKFMKLETCDNNYTDG